MTTAERGSRERLTERITGLIEADELRQGLATCQDLNRTYPGYAYGWYLASHLLRKLRHYRDAVAAIDRALQIEPSDRYRLHRAKCLLESGDLGGAQAAAAALRDVRFDEAVLHGDCGNLHYRLGDQSAALVHYTRAAELEPGNAELHFNRAAALRSLGDAEGADAAFDTAIGLRPDEYEAYNGRAQLRRQTRERNHVAQIEAMLARTSDPVGRIQLHYALAKEREDLGDYEEAFASLQQGADLKRRHMQYDVGTDVGIMDKIREVFGARMFRGPIEGCPATGAIFVIGMPRTGTTLVERILGSHSAVRSAGELNSFALELVRLTQALPGPPAATRLEFVARTADLDFRSLGEAYMHSTAAYRSLHANFIDKLPFNFLYAGLIHLSLPRARIVSLRRHPMDTCYAVYKQLFKDAYPFSYDLGDLGRYYAAYDRLMRHWDEVMPGVILTVRYEDLVIDLEGQARRLLDHCGLPWEEQCLRFHENPQASTTASALQVRQPIYDTSVGRWRRYARQLEPLRTDLARAGVATD